MRSRAAASLLAGAGFGQVASLAGGIRAWNGLVAEGPPEAGTAYFAAGASAAELAALAWYLEAGSRRFYAAVAASVDDPGSAELCRQLAVAEERHMERLRALAAQVAGEAAAASFPRGTLPLDAPDALMEGGVAVAQALEWSRGKPAADLLEYCIALETNSYDLYLRMLAANAGAEASRVFELLAREEQRHLERLTARFEQLAGAGAAGGEQA